MAPGTIVGDLEAAHGAHNPVVAVTANLIATAIVKLLSTATFSADPTCGVVGAGAVGPMASAIAAALAPTPVAAAAGSGYANGIAAGMATVVLTPGATYVPISTSPGPPSALGQAIGDAYGGQIAVLKVMCQKEEKALIDYIKTCNFVGVHNSSGSPMSGTLS